MTRPADFSVWCDDERVLVRFVSARALGRMKSGHAKGGDYGDKMIRLPRFETRAALRSLFMHEIGHYFVERAELRPWADATEEDACDLLAWLPAMLHDPRNDALRSFLGLRVDAPRASR